MYRGLRRILSADSSALLMAAQLPTVSTLERSASPSLLPWAVCSERVEALLRDRARRLQYPVGQTPEDSSGRDGPARSAIPGRQEMYRAAAYLLVDSSDSIGLPPSSTPGPADKSELLLREQRVGLSATTELGQLSGRTRRAR